MWAIEKDIHFWVDSKNPSPFEKDKVLRKEALKIADKVGNAMTSLNDYHNHRCARIIGILADTANRNERVEKRNRELESENYRLKMMLEKLKMMIDERSK